MPCALQPAGDKVTQQAVEMLSKIVEVPWAKCKPDSAGRSKDVVQCPLVVGAEMPRGPDGKPAKPVDGRLPKPVGPYLR